MPLRTRLAIGAALVALAWGALAAQHADSAEWWMVMVGQISGRFESGEVIGSEGDSRPFVQADVGRLRPSQFQLRSRAV